MPKALVIGIDDYKQAPLTSAVHDALAFRSELIDLGLATAADIALFTSPAQPGGAAASSKAIKDWLYDNVYLHGDTVDRFIFFYAGHGILAFSNAARTYAGTALVPADVEDLRRDGSLLIDFTELLEVLSQIGPEEQLFFVNACRDMPYEEQPDVPSLGWSGRKVGAQRNQFTIYAVSPLGKARGSRNGMGVMTGFLLEGLRGEGLALEYDSGNFEYMVTMRSLSAHAREKVRLTLEKEPAWTQKYQLPTSAVRGQDPRPLRTFKTVDPAPLTVHIVPDAAAALTQVRFSVGNYDLAEKFCFPINHNHDTVHLEPQRHLMIATSALGIPEPSRQPVDVRVTHEITITLPQGAPLPGAPPAAPAPPAPVALFDSGVAPATVSASRAVLLGPELSFEVNPEPDDPIWGRYNLTPATPAGIVEATALEAQVEILLESLSPPYESWKETQHLRQTVTPGPYRMQFRLGPDVFSQQEIFVRADEHLTVQPSAAITPLLAETVAGGPGTVSGVVISETIGAMQAAVLPTMLPMIAIKPFDLGNQLFQHLSGLIQIQPVDPAQFDNRPLSLVLAVDGNSWSAPVSKILRGIRCSVVAMDGSEPMELEPLPPLGGGADGEGLGFHRLFRTIGPAPLGSFLIALASEELGEFSLASAGLHNRATVVTAIFRPDGSLDVAQNLLRLPGMDYPGEENPPATYGRLLRTLQIGQALYRSDELYKCGLRPGNDETSSLLFEALHSKWVDPILGCMAYYAVMRALATDENAAASYPVDLLETSAQNLYRLFPELPDTGVIYADYASEFGDSVRYGLLSQGSLPLLAESARQLAGYARTHGWESAAVVGLARSTVPGQPWLRVPMLLRGPISAAAEAT